LTFLFYCDNLASYNVIVVKEFFILHVLAHQCALINGLMLRCWS